MSTACLRGAARPTSSSDRPRHVRPPAVAYRRGSARQCPATTGQRHESRIHRARPCRRQACRHAAAQRRRAHRCGISIERLPRHFWRQVRPSPKVPGRWPKTARWSSPACRRRLHRLRSWKGAGGVLSGIGPGKIWLEMSTTDAGEIRRLAALVEATGADAVDCPVSGRRASRGDRQHFDPCRLQA